MTTNYKRLTDEQMLNLIQRRAQRMRFHKADLDDAVQEVAMNVLPFEFDSNKWNRASYLTVVVAVIDRRLRMVRRRETCYRRYVSARLQSIRDIYDSPSGPVEPFYIERKDMISDVRAAVASLPDRDRVICTLLGAGLSVAAIAERLGCDWHTVEHRIAKVREHFEKLGLQKWLYAK